MIERKLASSSKILRLTLRERRASSRMMKTFVSDKQRLLFNLLSQSGELVFACGPKGITSNLVGEFTVRRNHHQEDQLDIGDGTHHVHIDWMRVKRFEVGDFHGEGMLTFFDGAEPIFKIYRTAGSYSQSIADLAKRLVD